MTYAEFVRSIKDTAFPDREAANLVTSHNKYIVDALIEVQRRVPQLRSHNYNLYPFESTYHRCRSTLIPKPDGPLARLYTYTHEDQCDSVFYYPTTREAMEAYMARAQAMGTSMSPMGGETVGGEFIPFEPLPLGVFRAESITNKGWRASGGYYALINDYVFVYPHIESNERVGIEWNGIKTSYALLDLVDYGREVQEVVELWLSYNSALREDCDNEKAAALVAHWSTRMAELVWWYRTKATLPDPAWRNDPCVPCMLATQTEEHPRETFTSFCFLADSGYVDPASNTASPQSQVIDLVDRLAPDFIIHGGDVAYPAAVDPDLTLKFLIPWDKYIPERLDLAFGNRDLNMDLGVQLLSHFPSISAANEGNLFYSVSKPNVDFFFLNTGKDGIKEIDIGTNQVNWLTTELADSLAQRPSSWRIVVMHKPLMTSASNHTNDTDLPTLPELDVLGADLLLTGHGHLYERIEKCAGCVQLTAGTGGAPLSVAAIPPVPESKKVVVEYGCVRIAASSSRLMSSFYSITGKILDTIELMR